MDSSAVAYLLQGAALGITAATSPGPLQSLLISESLVGGWRRGAPVAFAPLVTAAPIIFLVVVVLKQLPPMMIQALRLGGGLFVVYLAVGLWRQGHAGAATETRATQGRATAWASLRRGVLVNVLGPGPYVFWGLVNGPILLSALAQSPLDGAVFVVSFYALAVSTMLGLVLLFHQARRLGPRVVRGLLLVSIVILLAFGVALIRAGLFG